MFVMIYVLKFKMLSEGNTTLQLLIWPLKKIYSFNILCFIDILSLQQQHT